MFTLGNKEIIVNHESMYPVSVSGTELVVDKYVTVDTTKITDAVGSRYVWGSLDRVTFAVPSAAELGIDTSAVNTPISFTIRIYSIRDDGASGVNYIKKHRNFVIEFLVNGADTADDVAQKLGSAFEEYIMKFHMSDDIRPVLWTYDPATGLAKISAMHIRQFFGDYVQFSVSKQRQPILLALNHVTEIGNAIQDDTSAPTYVVNNAAEYFVGDKVTTLADAGTMYTVTDVDLTANTVTLSGSVAGAVGDQLMRENYSRDEAFIGQYLEENVRMSLPNTSDSYAIAPEQLPFRKGKYATITFEASDEGVSINNAWARHKFLGSTRGEVGGDRLFKFTMYLLESADLFGGAGSYVDLIAQAIDANAASTVWVGSNLEPMTASEFATL